MNSYTEQVRHDSCQRAHATPGRTAIAIAAALLVTAPAATAQYEIDLGFQNVSEVGTSLMRSRVQKGLHSYLGYRTVGTRNNFYVTSTFGADGWVPAPVQTEHVPLFPVTVVPHIIRPVSDSGFIVGGECPNFRPGTEIFLARYLPNGTLAWGGGFWGMLYSGHASGIGYGTRVLEMSRRAGFAAIGNTNLATGTHGVFFTVNWATGALICWNSFAYGGGIPVRFDDFCRNPDGSFTIVGRLQMGAQAPRWTLLLTVRVDERACFGGVVCAATYLVDQTEDVEQQAITRTANGDYVVWGHYSTTSSIPGSFLLRVAGNCQLTTRWRRHYRSIHGTRPTVIERVEVIGNQLMGTLVCNGRTNTNPSSGILMRTNAMGLAPVAARYPLSAPGADNIYQVIMAWNNTLGSVGSCQVPDPQFDQRFLKTNRFLQLPPSTSCYLPWPVSVETRTPSPAVRGIAWQGPGTYYYLLLSQRPNTRHSRRCPSPSSLPTLSREALSLSLPFNESAGTVAHNVGHWWGAPHGAHGNEPTILSQGKVGRALGFDGVNDRVDVPNYKAINVARGDFTIGAWIKLVATPSGIAIIVDKRQASPRLGYSFFLTGGRLALQLADGTITTVTSSSADMVVPADNAWHYVAVSVSRSGTSSFYRDGFSESFSIVARSGSLQSAAPLRIGASNDGLPAWSFAGSIDEVEVFRSALPAEAIEAIYLADQAGRHREFFRLPAQVALGRNQNSVTITGMIHNHTEFAQTYSLSLQGLDEGAGATVNGPTSFSPAGPIVIGPVAAGSERAFTMTVDRPEGMTAANLVGAYEATIESTSGSVLTQQCAIVDRRDLSVTGTGWDGTLSAAGLGVTTTLGPITLTNHTAAAMTVHYRLLALHDDGSPDAAALSLNGQGPGTPVTGSAPIGAGSTFTLNATAAYVDVGGIGNQVVQLEADMDGDGEYDFLAARSLRCLVGGTAAVSMTYGTGCGGLDLTSTPPVLGTTARLTLANVPAGTLAAIGLLGSPFPAGLDLSFLGMTGCSLLVLPIAAQLPFVVSGSTASLNLAIPDSPSLIAGALGAQAVTLGANLASTLTANGVQWTLGDI